MASIREYFKDDDEEQNIEENEHDIEDSTAQNKMKCPSNSQYVQIDFNTMNFSLFNSHQSKHSLNAQLAEKSQVFKSKDFFECVSFFFSQLG